MSCMLLPCFLLCAQHVEAERAAKAAARAEAERADVQLARDEQVGGCKAG